MESLNSLVAYYQNTGLGLGEIVKRLSLRIYNYPIGKFQSEEDDCGEFYLYFYPRLLRSLGRYQDRGKPFEWYFNSVLCWHYKMYCARKRRERSRLAVARNALIWEPAEPVVQVYPQADVCESGWKIIPIDRFGGSRYATCRKRVLFLALKNARQLNDAALAGISAFTGVEEGDLASMVERLRASLYRRELCLHKLYRRRNKAFTRILLLQRQLLWESEPEIKAQIAVSVCELQAVLQSLYRRIRRIRLHPSNREIAELLRIPKGTVDTSLYWLRRRLREESAGSVLDRQPSCCA